MSRYLIALSLAAIMAGGLCGARAAHAGALTGNPPSQVVRVYGFELSSDVGIARVHERLKQAAREVCDSFDSRDPERQMRYRRCVADALERAVRDIHDGRLTAYHRSKAGALRTVELVARSVQAAR
jgi:UrcA family protein